MVQWVAHCTVLQHFFPPNDLNVLITWKLHKCLLLSYRHPLVVTHSSSSSFAASRKVNPEALKYWADFFYYSNLSHSRDGRVYYSLDHGADSRIKKNTLDFFLPGLSTPRGSSRSRSLPSPRVISVGLTLDEDRPDRHLTLALMQWGQFVYNDMSHTVTSHMCKYWL